MFNNSWGHLLWGTIMISLKTPWAHLVGSLWRLENVLQTFRNSQEIFDESVWTTEQILNKSFGNHLGVIGNPSGVHEKSLRHPQEIP